MLNLELELILILVLTTVIGLLMGRFLCKSGENDEREKKKKLIHALSVSKNELEISREKVKDQAFVIKMKEDLIAEHEQEINNFNTKLLSSNRQQEELLAELKKLEKYKTRFESLQNEFKVQSKTIESLKSEKLTLFAEIEELKIMINGLNKNITHLTNHNRQKEMDFGSLEKKKTKLHEVIETKDRTYSDLKKELECVEEEYMEFKLNYNLDTDRLESLERENTKIYHTLEAIILERDDLLSRLRAISSVVGAVGIDKVDNPIPLLER